MKNNLFAEFQKVSKDEWVNLAIKDLKGKDFQKTLVTNAPDGIDLFPFYTEEDSHDLGFLKKFRNRLNVPSEIPGTGPRFWSNVHAVRVNDEKADNKNILKALMGGADALLLDLKGKVDFEILLSEVDVRYIEVYLRVENEITERTLDFFNWMERSDFSNNDLKGGLLWDPMTSCLESKCLKQDQLDIAEKLLQIGIKFPSFRLISVDAAHYHDCGASPVQQLFLSLGGYIELMDGLTDRGILPVDILKKTILQGAAGSDFFLEIAKLRVFKIAFFELAILYKEDFILEDVKLFASSSYWTKATSDVHTNMLRNTTEAMSAILGSCDALWVRPHNEVIDEIDSFSERMARNISNILKEECYLDKVLDPVAGTYFIECVQAGIIDKVKRELQILEEKGGWWVNFENHQLQDLVKAARYTRLEEVKNAHKVKVGVNKYLLQNEDPKNALENWEEETWQLLPLRDGFLIEFPNLEKK
ncbi:methylmalonyl-CoA mutase family protein [Arthrospiribacter ruber]|nr:methylmalonyl-CoA mutase family protein [Arthrospiribacter ruber]